MTVLCLQNVTIQGNRVVNGQSILTNTNVVEFVGVADSCADGVVSVALTDQSNVFDSQVFAIAFGGTLSLWAVGLGVGMLINIVRRVR